MTTNPADFIEMTARSGASIITVHAETINTDAFRTINLIHSLGCKVGIALNPATPLSYIQHYIDRVDVLTIMGIDIGFTGQSFIDEMLGKIRAACELREKNGYSYAIQVDGGGNKANYRSLNDAGTEIFIVGGSGLFSLDSDLEVACQKMKAEFQTAIAD